jgi:hypothetical protein
MFYEFLTDWSFDAPLRDVWDAIYHSEHWPEWWQGVESVVEIAKGRDDGIGNQRRYSWRGVIPYRLVFDIRTTRVETAALLEGVATGDLEGTGIWRFGTDGERTAVHYEWRVRTTKSWMNLLSPLAGPLFRWNHDRVMASGEAGLAKTLRG